MPPGPLCPQDLVSGEQQWEKGPNFNLGVSCKGSGTKTGWTSALWWPGSLGGQWAKDVSERSPWSDHCCGMQTHAGHWASSSSPTQIIPSFLPGAPSQHFGTAADTRLQHPGQRPPWRLGTHVAFAFRNCSPVTHPGCRMPRPSRSLCLGLLLPKAAKPPVVPHTCMP